MHLYEHDVHRTYSVLKQYSTDVHCTRTMCTAATFTCIQVSTYLYLLTVRCRLFYIRCIASCVQAIRESLITARWCICYLPTVSLSTIVMLLAIVKRCCSSCTSCKTSTSSSRHDAVSARVSARRLLTWQPPLLHNQPITSSRLHHKVSSRDPTFSTPFPTPAPFMQSFHQATESCYR